MPQLRPMSGRPHVPEILLEARPFLPDNKAIWIVGGWVRDQLLGRESSDFDLVVAGPARQAGRSVANGLGAAYFDLDRERDTGRVLVRGGGEGQVTLDFARLDSGGIEADLRKRDFTVNALALRLWDTGDLLDVTGGLKDLEQGAVRACGPTAVADDPVRGLRAVRLAAQLGFDIEPETVLQIRQVSTRLASVSAERVRDELFCILALPSSIDAIRRTIELGLMIDVLPELAPLDGLVQHEPHRFDALEHSLRVADSLTRWVHEPSASSRFWPQFEPCVDRIQHDLRASLAFERTRAQLLVLAGLLHDVGKPEVQVIRDDGSPDFHGHEEVGADMAKARGRALRLSRGEVDSLGRIVANHMLPGRLAKESSIAGREVYRFFQATGDDGVGVCLLSLADLAGQSDASQQGAKWEGRIRVVKRLADGFYDRYGQEVEPKMLIDGHDLIKELGLDEGPEVGDLLELIRQAQADGVVHTRADALALAMRQRQREDATGKG
jgi:poly(A) polymerase